ncbi:MAG: hypothetical protein HOP12_08025 [Candidatus Eisenbacteria bacterium]|uniref:Peptidase S55 domain-containing protein n=1 Tax=Eiseniibacteriota bacterium TaxID=2212470 RepID=A0A849SFF3_UNCEI|nr:hypothetical protein [Candidatus Eisenbacteria bacterium]
MALAVLSAWFGFASAAPVPILTADRLKAGMKAQVLTVFVGERIDTFSAEIVGVMSGGRAEGDQIVARATDPRAIRSGIAQGMSGSPVYVDGKLIGALSGGWSFVREPVFVITPIAEMLAVLDQPEHSSASGTSGPAGLDLGLETHEPRYQYFRWSEESTLSIPAPAAPETSGPGAAFPALGLSRPLALPLAASGLHPGSRAIAAELLAPLGLALTSTGGGSGRASSSAPRAVAGKRSGSAASQVATIEPGAAVAVDILRGDLNLSAIGTLTYRDGDRVLIFGHPLFQAGEVKLPLSRAEITTIIPTDVSSFKLGRPGEPIGTATQDRRAAMAGRLGPVPHLLPITVSLIEASRRRNFHFESIEDRTLLPSMVGIAAFNSLMESGGAGAGQTLRWTLRASGPGRELTMSDVVAGEAPGAEMLNAISGPLRFLAGNPYERLALDSIQVAIEIEPRREQWVLRGVRLATAAVRPGGIAHVACEVESWRGGRRTVMLQVPVPHEVPAGRYSLFVGGAAELMRMEAARLPGRYRPTTLDDAIDRFNHWRSSDALRAVLIARAPEVTRSGIDYPELPTSALALLAPGTEAGDDIRRGDRLLLSETRFALEGVVRGEVMLEFVVDEDAP